METKVSTPSRIDRQKLGLMIRLKRGDRSYRAVQDDARVYFRSLQHFESGKTLPSLENYVRICEWLGVEMDFFVREGADT